MSRQAQLLYNKQYTRRSTPGRETSTTFPVESRGNRIVFMVVEADCVAPGLFPGAPTGEPGEPLCPAGAPPPGLPAEDPPACLLERELLRRCEEIECLAADFDFDLAVTARADSDAMDSDESSSSLMG